MKRANDRYLTGVCGGLADQFKVSPLAMGIVFSLVSLITFLIPGLILYLVLTFSMLPPDE